MWYDCIAPALQSLNLSFVIKPIYKFPKKDKKKKKTRTNDNPTVNCTNLDTPESSTQIRHVDVLQFRFGRVLKQRCPILALPLLHPVTVHPERATIHDLKHQNVKSFVDKIDKIISITLRSSFSR